ncbi:aldo/keto reductase [Criibacterium bergeronii]|uniref:aldo/keto reductase n=1 Tax=Criibacterium bergeronii TaxID=1871336 RepID=UPI000AD36192|nr:aldo/keto reductase [Criibacterium bergeronii]MBS6063003.1 aldo/keto reductase [Peptostreptococcaceae bacterium]
MIFDEKIKLNNGNEIPKLALGTWLIDDAIVADAVVNAIEIGYRHIDTAQAYENERGVGEGIRKSAVPREKLFVTSKIQAEIKDYVAAKKSIDDTLNLMGLDYLDLMIIHSPQPWAEYNKSENRYYKENKEVWKALQEAYEAGKVKNIGISNFKEQDIQNILEDCKIKPVINQILCHISNTPLEVIAYCQKNDIQVEAYSPIAHGKSLDNPVIKEIAQKYNVSVPQLCIRYDWQLNTIVLPKTANKEHMKQNADINFEISAEDMETLKHLNKIKDYGELNKFAVYGHNDMK